MSSSPAPSALQGSPPSVLLTLSCVPQYLLSPWKSLFLTGPILRALSDELVGAVLFTCQDFDLASCVTEEANPDVPSDPEPLRDIGYDWWSDEETEPQPVAVAKALKNLYFHDLHSSAETSALTSPFPLESVDQREEGYVADQEEDKPARLENLKPTRVLRSHTKLQSSPSNSAPGLNSASASSTTLLSVSASFKKSQKPKPPATPLPPSSPEKRKEESGLPPSKRSKLTVRAEEAPVPVPADSSKKKGQGGKKWGDPMLKKANRKKHKQAAREAKKAGPHLADQNRRRFLERAKVVNLLFKGG
ncbi:hypothetical protein BOTBODRAFT_178795 [Botryobasidium botryosum FD-172 SS1]|uniref:Uncharacterized protein n=1 Tax=Botryobasidium botryosum (strain FD-172 SS1) TaxID=930990 RepID=A0A067MCW9_BOTB1|nr:hypothetical protein BOTBODRAFT_178795 [Botryobasidium botryosum FD-172 SS1]